MMPAAWPATRVPVAKDRPLSKDADTTRNRAVWTQLAPNPYKQLYVKYNIHM